MTEKQVSLLDEMASNREALKEEMKEISVEDVQVIGCIPPGDEFVESVRQFGVIEPIVVVPNKNDHHPYRVLNGRRRVAAAKIVGIETLKAVVRVYENDAMSLLVSLIAQQQRSSNPVAELKAVLELVKMGYMLEEIIQISGIPEKRLEKLMRLGMSPITILDAVSDGKVALGTALAFSKLSSAKQRKLWDKFQEDGKLTGKDVEGARMAEVNAELKNVPIGIDLHSGETVSNADGDGMTEIDGARLPIPLIDTAHSLMAAYEISYQQWMENAWRLAIEKIEKEEKKARKQ